MRIMLWRTAALVACLGLLFTESASAQRQREYQSASDAAERASASLASYNSFDTCSYDDCGNGDCNSGNCGCNSCSGGGGRRSGGGGRGLDFGGDFLSHPGQFFVGAEYIYARASFSEALAYIVTDANNPNGGNDFVEYDFEYQSSYRLYGGYRLLDCGCEVVFNFARYQSEATANIDPAVGQTVNGPYEVNGRQNNSADVDIQSYDLGISKTIPLGGCYPCCDPCGDDCCGSDSCCGDGYDCGDGCSSGCGYCPYWDITWSAGLRFARVGWGRNQVAIGGTPTAPFIDQTADTQLNFDGAGARVGLLGRRYLGRRRLASIYARGDISLLVGNMSISTVNQEVDLGDPPVFSYRNSARRVIPVTEIEAGVSAHLGDNITLSSGYFIAAWHDLGMRDVYNFGTIPPGLQLSSFDDANILGFDGFFARAELAF